MSLFFHELWQMLNKKIEDPEVSTYFLQGKQIDKEDPNYEKVMQIAQEYCSYLDLVVLQESGQELAEKNAKSVKKTYDNCPAIQLYLVGKETKYSDQFFNVIK
jgi:3-deoxy-D-manno-octulosonic-acid transferase